MKSGKPAVHYRRAVRWWPFRLIRCGTCSMRTPDGCTAVAGPIRDSDMCDLWSPARRR